ncbi:hypothetical protein [Amycolatopsis sp. NPDC059657]
MWGSLLLAAGPQSDPAIPMHATPIRAPAVDKVVQAAAGHRLHAEYTFED